MKLVVEKKTNKSAICLFLMKILQILNSHALIIAIIFKFK